MGSLILAGSLLVFMGALVVSSAFDSSVLLFGLLWFGFIAAGLLIETFAASRWLTRVLGEYESAMSRSA